MPRPPELVAFLLANAGLFIVSSLLTVLTYFAYRRSERRTSYRLATVGFGCVVLGGLVDPVYLLLTPGDTYLHSSELLVMQAGESILIAMGLGLLFYAILRHDSGSRLESVGGRLRTGGFTETEVWESED